MRPCSGDVDWVKKFYGKSLKVGMSHYVVRRTAWIHCGFHIRRSEKVRGATEAPSPCDMPRLKTDGKDRHFDFHSLRRDEPGLRPARVRSYVLNKDNSNGFKGYIGHWMVERDAHEGEEPLRFLVDNREQANAWKHQLLMRAVPYCQLLTDHYNAVRRIESVAGGDAGPSTRQTSSGLWTWARIISEQAVHIRDALPNDVVSGIIGVAAAVTHDTVYNLGVAAGPLACVGLDILLGISRVFAMEKGMPQEVAELSTGMLVLSTAIKEQILPYLKLSGSEGKLLRRVGSLVSNMEVLEGHLLHIVRPRSERWKQAFSAVLRGTTTPARYLLQKCDEEAEKLVPLLQNDAILASVQQQEADRAEAMRIEYDAAPPTLPKSTYACWEDTSAPATIILQAIMHDGAFTSDADGTVKCTAVAAEGMGGVGKTTACMLVADKVAKGAQGKCRFPHGVYWVQLSQNTTKDGVKDKLCSLASCLSAKMLRASRLDQAEKHLREALAGKTCLVIVDDVWKHIWVRTFVDALSDSTASAVLFSTRMADIGHNVTGFQPVRVDTLSDPVARQVFLTHAHRRGVRSAGLADDAVEQCIQRCGGLPFALAVLGAHVARCGATEALARFDHAKLLTASTDMSAPQSDYTCLWACLRASHMWLGVDIEDRTRASKRFRALCVVAKKERIPRSALAKLWAESEDDSEWIAEELRNAALVTLSGTGAGLHLELHDLVVEYLAHPKTLTQRKRVKVHAKLVNQYSRRGRVHDETTTVRGQAMKVRRLWELKSDDYIERALPRLLHGGGEPGQRELKLLLCNMEFIAWRVKVAGGRASQYRLDCRQLWTPLLYRIVIIVEGVLRHKYDDNALRQSAWEIVQLAPAWQPDDVEDGVADLIRYLTHSAKQFARQPTVELYGPVRLQMPQYRQSYTVESTCTDVLSFVSGNGKPYVAVADRRGGLSLFERQTGELQDVLLPTLYRTIGNEVTILCSYCFASSRKLVTVSGPHNRGRARVAGSQEQTVTLFDMETGAFLPVLRGHTGYVTCLAVLPGNTSDRGAQLVSGSWDKTVRVWDLYDPAPPRVLDKHTGAVRCVAVVGSEGEGGRGARVLSGSDDCTVRVWDLGSMSSTALVLVGNTAPVTHVAGLVHGTGDCPMHVVSGSEDGRVLVWDSFDPSVRRVIDRHHGPIWDLVVVDGCARDAAAVVAASSRAVRMRRLDGTLVCQLLQEETTRWSCVRGVLSKTDSRAPRAVLGSVSGAIGVWDLDGSSAPRMLNGHSSPVTSLAAVEGGDEGGMGQVLSAGGTSVRLWDLSGSVVEHASAGHTSGVSCLAFVRKDASERGELVVSGSLDGSIRVWAASDGSAADVLLGHSAAVTHLVGIDGDASGRGARLVSGCKKGEVRLWDLKTSEGKVLQLPSSSRITDMTLTDDRARSGHVRVAICLSRNRRTAPITVADDREISRVDVDSCMLVLDVDTLSVVGKLSSPARVSQCMTSLGSGIGSRVVVGNDYGEGPPVTVWDLNSRSLVGSMQGPKNKVSFVAVVGGGSSGRPALVVAALEHQPVGAWDVFVVDVLARDVLAWDVETGAQVNIPHLRTGASRCAQWLPRGPPPARGEGSQVATGLTSAGFEHCLVLYGSNGPCFLLDPTTWRLRHFPSPTAEAVCCLPGGRLAWGTSSGDVLFGRLRL